MKNTKTALALGLAVVLASAAGVQASTVVGGITFNDNAFADQLVSSVGSFVTSGGTLSQVLTDTDPGTYAFSNDANAQVVLKFTDNLVVNGAGNDLAVFELGTNDSFNLAVTIGGTTHTYTTVGTGFSAGGFDLNVAQIDLSTFGLASGATIDTVQLFSLPNSSNGTVPSFSLVGAINSADVGTTAAPLPASALSGGAMLAGLATLTILRKKTAAAQA